MSEHGCGDTLPRLGHVTGLREQWLVRTDGALAHRLQDREISSHLCENRCRNQQIREDFPVAVSEQRDIEREAYLKEAARRRQADVDAEIAREMAEINLRRRRRRSAEILQPRREPPPPPDDINPEELGLSPAELLEMRRRLEQEELDARLARQLSDEVQDRDCLVSDMRYAVEAQDSELARLLQEREYKKLQRAKERARQKALLKKQQRLAEQQTQPALLDAYSNPRDMIHRQPGMRLSKSVDSDLHYVEPFEKEHIQSKANAIQSKEMSRQWLMRDEPGTSQDQLGSYRPELPSPNSIDLPDNVRNMPSSQTIAAMQHRQPPPVPTSGKKPRFPDPVSIRPASHYPADSNDNSICSYPSTIENNNIYGTTFPPDGTERPHGHMDKMGPSKRLSVISDISPEDLNKKKNKKKGCKIQ